MSHYEDQYLDLMRRIWTEGAVQEDRTGVGTRSLFGATMRFSLADNAIPLLTTKRIFWKTAAREMLWFLTGDTNIRNLLKQKVRIWTDWPLERYRRETGDAISQEDFEQRIVDDINFAEQWGDLGPVYGAQWVNWPKYEDAGQGLYRRAEKGINQIELLVQSLKTNPGSRRHIFEGWNVAELDQMALPPCHKTYQFHVADGVLSGLLFQRSCDLGLGFPGRSAGQYPVRRPVCHRSDHRRRCANQCGRDQTHCDRRSENQLLRVTWHGRAPRGVHQRDAL